MTVPVDWKTNAVFIISCATVLIVPIFVITFLFVSPLYEKIHLQDTKISNLELALQSTVYCNSDLNGNILYNQLTGKPDCYSNQEAFTSVLVNQSNLNERLQRIEDLIVQAQGG